MSTTPPGRVPVTFFGGPFDGQTMQRPPSGRYRLYFTCSSACNLDVPWHDHPLMATYQTIAWTEEASVALGVTRGQPTAILALIVGVEDFG